MIYKIQTNKIEDIIYESNLPPGQVDLKPDDIAEVTLMDDSEAEDFLLACEKYGVTPTRLS